jgi:pyruvate, orthophosphate dikinase
MIGGTMLNEGEFLSLDGNTGAVHLGCLTPVVERPERALAAVASWRHTVGAADISAERRLQLDEQS